MWKPIMGWENLYYINECGEVYSIRTKKCVKGDINNVGYCRVCLYDKANNRKERYFRHRLVATHFIDNPNSYKEVNHIDGDKTSNSVSNLEWVSREQNEMHCRRDISTKDYKPFKVVYESGEEVVFDVKPQLAKMLNVTPECVKQWLKGRTQGYRNYGILSIEYI